MHRFEEMKLGFARPILPIIKHPNPTPEQPPPTTMPSPKPEAAPPAQPSMCGQPLFFSQSVHHNLFLFLLPPRHPQQDHHFVVVSAFHRAVRQERLN